MSIYERIESLCAEAMEDASDMCLSAGISEEVLAEMKIGKEDNVTDDVLREVADSLNTSMDYLYGWTDDPTNYSDPDLLLYIPLDILHEWEKEDLDEEEKGRRAVAFQKAQEEDALRESSEYAVQATSVVNMTPVRSTHLASVGYENGTLYVRFHQGGTYAYFDVPASEYEVLTSDGAPGKYFWANIRNRYSYRKID